jgi:hypothetical protein
VTDKVRVEYYGENMEIPMKIASFLLVFSLVLAACSRAPQASSTTAQSSPRQVIVEQPTPTAEQFGETAVTVPPEISEPIEQEPSPTEDLVRNDEQGQISVAVTPVNLTDPGETVEFEVGLNTHSVDLSMDLAALATLTTDTGATVQASQWDAPGGGHHVSGKLIFPAAVDGAPLLEGAATLTLTIKNLDVPERVFTWELNM